MILGVVTQVPYTGLSSRRRDVHDPGGGVSQVSYLEAGVWLQDRVPGDPEPITEIMEVDLSSKTGGK